MAPSCDICGSHVSSTWERVVSTPEGKINGCPNCQANARSADPRAGEEDD